MLEKNLRKLLKRLAVGEISLEQAMARLKDFSVEDLGVAQVDHHRGLRQGFAEVIYCAGKTEKEVETIARAILKKNPALLATRATAGIFARLRKLDKTARFHERSGAITIEREKSLRAGNVLVVSAGTSDLPVAEEAAVTADIMGSKVDVLHDVGVAGIHRLLHHVDKLAEARVIVVTAGMDGALASVVGGLVSRPVIAVPTSVGYGASFGGVSALLAMLNSCAAGVAVMNIDNGFGAGALAHKINTLPESLAK
ncbi:MAG: nickel pincer cofactor biosynthesis protein LarB [Nitrospinota bacterium]|nr:nickel pincer cofactor biosynthesis protein LarB [Nitrospinota bacterium]